MQHGQAALKGECSVCLAAGIVEQRFDHRDERDLVQHAGTLADLLARLEEIDDGVEDFGAELSFELGRVREGDANLLPQEGTHPRGSAAFWQGAGQLRACSPPPAHALSGGRDGRTGGTLPLPLPSPLRLTLPWTFSSDVGRFCSISSICLMFSAFARTLTWSSRVPFCVAVIAQFI